MPRSHTKILSYPTLYPANGLTLPTMAEESSMDAKIVFLGATSVGKTSIICRAVSDEFDSEMPATIGACYTAKQVDVDHTSVNLQIWDTAGQERFRTLAPMYYRGSVVAVLVYSVTDEKSLQDVKAWVDEIKQQTDDMPKIFVVGNKMDLESERVVSTEQGEQMARQLNAEHSETSAKNGRGIEELFTRVAQASVKKVKGDVGKPAPQQPEAGKVSLVASSGGKGKKKNCNC